MGSYTSVFRQFFERSLAFDNSLPRFLVPEFSTSSTSRGSDMCMFLCVVRGFVPVQV